MSKIVLCLREKEYNKKKIILGCVIFLIVMTSINIKTNAYYLPEPDERSEFLAIRKSYDLKEEKMTKMSTSALLGNILNNKYLIDLLAYDDLQHAIEIFADEYDSVNELYKRDDLFFAVADNYKRISNSEKLFNDNYMEILLLKMLISYKPMINQMNENQKSLMVDIMFKDKVKWDNKYGTNSYTSLISSSLLDMYRYEELPFQTDFITSNYITAAYTTTYRGSTIELKGPRNDEALLYEEGDDLYQLIAHFASCYPNATMLAGPSLQYNCHSYAWYSQSVSNPYCIFAQSAFVNDGSYTPTNNLVSNPNEIYRIVYMIGGSAEHSGIVNSPYSLGTPNYSTMTVTSKWGVAGLYSHTVYHCPYANNTPTIFEHCHYYTHSSNNANQHNCECGCGYQYLANHQYVYSNSPSNNVQHYVSCFCGHSFYENHDYQFDALHNYYECTKCGKIMIVSKGV